MRSRLTHKLNKVIFRLSPVLAERCNIDFKLETPSRAFMENEIFSYVNRLVRAANQRHRLLFLGMDRYNWHYPRLLHAVDFHSIDIRPERAKYGPPGRHIVGDVMDMARHYGEETFDIVVANGLLGFGVNTPHALQILLAQCHRVLKPGGLFVLGFNARADIVPFPVTLDEDMFDEFAPPIEGVRESRHMVDDAYKHLYVFAGKTAHDRPAAGAGLRCKWGCSSGLLPSRCREWSAVAIR